MREPSIQLKESGAILPPLEDIKKCKKCCRCKLYKPLENFNYKHRIRKTCFECYAIRSQMEFVNWRNDNPIKALLKGAKNRAKKGKLIFNLNESDILIPKYCPILGIRLRNKGHKKYKPYYNCPSIDRLDNAIGYISSNIIICSYRANTLKSNGTLKEFRKIYKFLKKYEESKLAYKTI